MGIFEGLFGGAKERERLEGLKRLEDKRLAFAQELSARGIRLEQSLFVQSGGGFIGIGISGGDTYLLRGPAPGDDVGKFEIQNINGATMYFEPFVIPGEGGGGVLGFGKKGGRGYKLIILQQDGERLDADFVPALQCILEVMGEPSALLSETRRHRDANFVWDFKPIQMQQMDDIVERWTKLLR